jgi:hypothetical protein
MYAGPVVTSKEPKKLQSTKETSDVSWKVYSNKYILYFPGDSGYKSSDCIHNHISIPTTNSILNLDFNFTTNWMN